MSDRIRVSVVFAEPGQVFLRELELPAGASVADAIAASGFRTTRPQCPLDDMQVGIFARKARMDKRLRDGDRVEIYRPLKIDPKEARRIRAGDASSTRR